MRILIVHNAYLHRGGEDAVVDAEIELLRRNGHVVEVYRRSNEELGALSEWRAAAQTLWSRQTTADLQTLATRFRPDLIHAHNTFPLVSPSLYWAAARARIPVVQTLHNFRLICLNALFLREDGVCVDCLGTMPWRGVMRSCYRDSRPASAVLASMLVLHRLLGSYRQRVARYIALNAFCRDKFIEGGLPEERIVVKPNFVDWDAPVPGLGGRGGLLFVGRLSAEKGVATLAAAAAATPEIGIRVAGTGPQAALLDGLPAIQRLGNLAAERVREEMALASALLIPSIWFENFPRTIVEAFASGLPVIASRIGALADIVRDGETGILFEPGSPTDLAEKMRWAQANPERMEAMGRAARAEYEARFSPAANYSQLMAIYEDALASEGAG